jgi:anaerobic selenocysteine-containing dehydrogenase
MEFVSPRMAEAGLDPVAGYTPAHETSQRDSALARDYPLALVTPANHYFLNSIFANVPQQRRRAGVTTLLIHPHDAAPRHIAAGDEVRRRARLVRGVADGATACGGVVASTKGRWPCD